MYSYRLLNITYDNLNKIFFMGRFYSHDSSFLHDGMATTKNELPAIGQKVSSFKLIKNSLSLVSKTLCHFQFYLL